MLLQLILLPGWSREFGPLLDMIADRPYWQYGLGSTPAACAVYKDLVPSRLSLIKAMMFILAI